MADRAVNSVGLFVDVQNVYYTCRQIHKANFDYNAFWQRATQDRELVCAVAYATDRGDPQQEKFQNILKAIGFEVKLKPMVQRRDGSAKADWDVGIALDIFEAAANCETVVLVSGDGDFEILLNRVRDRFNTRSEVYGVRQLTANPLIAAADKFIPIESQLLLPNKK
ncbi:MAG: NYN domain-containing protein [Pseudomonadota bacterium]